MNTSSSIDVYQQMIDTSLDVFGYTDRDGYIQQVSRACKNISGYECHELVGNHFSSFLHPDDMAETMLNFSQIFEQNTKLCFNNRYIHKNGQVLHMHWSGAWSDDGERLYFVGRDVTEQKLNYQVLREKEELHRALIEHGSDMLALFDEELNFKYSGGSTQRILGYTSEQLQGINVFSLIHPDDLPMVQEKLALVLATDSHTVISDFRFKDACGNWRWLETTISNQLYNPAVNALVTSSRDITERFNDKLRLVENEQRFKAMFEDNPDTVLVENRQGLIVDANRAAEALFGIPRHELINRHINEFLAPDSAPVCAKHLEEAFKGNTVKFILETHHEEAGHFILEVTKIPVNVNGHVLAVHTVVKDITASAKYQSAIETHAKKLTTIFESITDAFCTIDRNWRYTYVNSEFERQTKYSKTDFVGKSFFEVYPNAAETPFYQNYSYAMATGHSVHFDAYSDELDMWLNVKVYPSEDGLSIYFSDITEKVIAQKELEKLSLVANKAKNGVLIADKDWRIEWVNDGFTRLTGYTLAEAAGKRPSEFLHSTESDKTAFIALEPRLLQGEAISFEVLNRKKNGDDLWLAVEITPIFDDNNAIVRYIEVQTDITALKKSELDLSKLTKDLYRQNSDLQQFTYIVSHNLRSPVANALGLSSLLKRVDEGSSLFKKTLTNLDLSLTRLDTVLRDINTILSIRDTKGNFDVEEVKVSHVVQQALSSLQEPLEKCGGSVTLNLDENFSVRGNRAYLYSIFYNLLSNAVKYRSDARPLVVDISKQENSSTGNIILIKDNGVGFDMTKAKDNLFKLYKRFHTDRQGRGIGLYLVKSHLEAMDGHVEVKSQEGIGTEFAVYLP